MIANWILIEKETGRYVIPHMSVKKPVFGNNGHETDTHPTLDWVAWPKEQATDDNGVLLWEDEKKTIHVMVGKPLPEDIETARDEQGNSLYKWDGEKLVKNG